MELYEMRYYCAVYEKRSFSSAALSVNISQPAISQCIKKIETELREQCFIRTTRNLKPTNVGDIIYSYCKQIIALNDSMYGAISEITDAGKIELRVGMSPFYSKRYLPPIIQKVKEQFPNIRFHFEEIISEKQEEMLINGTLDFCCLPQDPEIKGLSYETICMEEILIALPPDSPLSSQAISASPLPFLNLKTLDGQKLVKLMEVQKVNKLLNPLLNNSGIKFRVAYETLDWDTVNIMIASGVGLGFVPDILFDNREGERIPKYYRITDKGFLRRYSIAYKTGETFSPLIRCIISLFKDTIREYRKNLINY